MTASEEYSPFVASEAGDASMLRMGTAARPQDCGPVFLSPFRVWDRVLQAFDSMLVQPLKTWMRLDREVSILRSLGDRDLRDIGINRVDIAAIRAGTYKRASADSAERTGLPTVRWDERPPQIFI